MYTASMRMALAVLGTAVLGGAGSPAVKAAGQPPQASSPAVKADADRQAPPVARPGDAGGAAAERGSDLPKTLPAPPADAAAAPVADAWPADEIIRAKAHCANILRSIHAVVIPEDPIKQGECGTPAPVRVVSVGRNPEVVLSPPPVLTCEMVSALAEWIKEDVQPLARTHLGAPVVLLETISSYSCRNAYNRKKTRLSEHGRVNALDLRRFSTSTGVDVDLRAHWGMTARDVRAAVAAAKAAEEKRAAEQQAKAAPDAAGAKAAGSGSAPPPGASAQIRSASATEKLGFRSETLVEGIKPSAASSRHSDTKGADDNSPNRLGGPRTAAQPASAAAPPAPDLSDRHTRFLRAAHVAACRRFGTVLGPEANEAHRDHFHLDMAERASGSFCE